MVTSLLSKAIPQKLYSVFVVYDVHARLWKNEIKKHRKHYVQIFCFAISHGINFINLYHCIITHKMYTIAIDIDEHIHNTLGWKELIPKKWLNPRRKVGKITLKIHYILKLFVKRVDFIIALLLVLLLIMIITYYYVPQTGILTSPQWTKQDMVHDEEHEPTSIREAEI